MVVAVLWCIRIHQKAAWRGNAKPPQRAMMTSPSDAKSRQLPVIIGNLRAPTKGRSKLFDYFFGWVTEKNDLFECTIRGFKTSSLESKRTEGAPVSH